MTQNIAAVDWLVICLYGIGLLALAWWLSRSQNGREDYYVGGRNLGAWPVGLSIMATQCSTNSILGAPAFVAFSAGGGLVWLQYELAVPLAMIVLMLFVMPMFRHLRLVSVYAYLERRFDLATRLTLSASFQLLRAFATAVTVYSIALVIELITGLGFTASVMLLGAFTIIYDVLGGIRGVIYSDVIQLLILVGMLVLVATLLVQEAGGLPAIWQQFDSERRQIVDFTHHGLGDGHTFAFWPMLLGGLFLYVSYYGCDQSQVQRQLSTRDIDTTNNALLINGLLRFPLVALYCFVGVGIAVYATAHPDFVHSLPKHHSSPQYNLAVPLYMINALPAGLVGLSLVALFAAAMSSLDSVLNSLSATTMEDFVRRFSPRHWSDRRELVYSRGITAIWGVITLSLAFYVGDIAPTVIEAINKIGSLANGPILAVFALGLLTRRTVGWHAISGLLLGVSSNALLWLYLPQVSWLWWNVIGFAVCFVTGVVLARLIAGEGATDRYTQEGLIRHYLATQAKHNWYRRSAWLLVWSCLLLLIMLVV
ncbi:MAG: sodium/solute symporter [Halioglobus sp.]|nr:sodium/solute symporter [Halioglobus sp.]